MGKTEIKAHFTVTVKNAFQLDGEAEGKQVFIAWKRGTKSTNKGETRKVNSRGNIAVFGDEINIDATLVQDPKSKKFESKKIEFIIKMEADKKKVKAIGKCEVDLADYCKQDATFDSVVVSAADKKKKGKADGPSIKLGIKCGWTHIDKKKIVPKGEASSTIEVGGMEIGVTTATDMSDEESTDIGGRLSDEDSELDMDDDFKEMAGGKKKSKEKKSDRRSTAIGSSGGAGGDLLVKELAKAKEDLAKEKEKTKEKMAKLTAEKEEVKKLKKELAAAKKGAGAVGAVGGAALVNDEVKSLRDQLEAAERQKKTLEGDLSRGKEDKDREIANLKADLQRARDDAARASKASSGSAEVDRLRKDVQQERERADKLQREAESLRVDVERARKDMDEEKGAAEKFKKQARDAEDNVSKLKEQVRNAEAKGAGVVAVTSTKPGKGGSEDTVSRSKFDKVNKTLQKRMDELKTLEKDVREKDAEIEKLKDEVERLEKNLQGLSAASKKLSGGASDKKDKEELAALQKKFDEARQKNDKLEKEVSKLKAQLDDASRSNGAGGGGGGDEATKQKLRKLEKEKEDWTIIEDNIYCMTAKYEDGSHVTAMQLTELLMDKHALDDPPNERLLARLLLAMKKAYQANSYDNNALVPWLSFGCMLHESLETEVGTSEDEGSGDIPENGIFIPRDGDRHDVDDDDPVATFFHNLETLIYEIYFAVLRNLYAQLNEVVVPGILQQPAVITDRGNTGAVSKHDMKSFTGILTDAFLLMKRHYIFDSVLQQFFSQVFYFLDAALFNHLVKRKDLCTCGSGFKIKLGLSQLEEWTNAPKADKRANADPKKDRKILTFAARTFLNHIHEAATVLVVGKDIFCDEKSILDAFPNLRPNQIKHLLESFQTDQFAPDAVPKRAITTLDNMSRHGDSRESSLEIDESHLLRLPKKQ